MCSSPGCGAATSASDSSSWTTRWRSGERPRTVAFGDNETVNVLDVKGMLDIDRYGRVFVDADRPENFIRDRELLAAERNVGFLRRCVEGFRSRQLRRCRRAGESTCGSNPGRPVWIDPEALQAAVADPDTRAGLRGGGAAARCAGSVCAAQVRGTCDRYEDGCRARRRREATLTRALPTLGVWGAAPARRTVSPESRNSDRRAPRGRACAGG